MPRILISLVLACALLVPLTACEPKECRKLKELICSKCKTNSPACRTVRKRRGRDKKKCKTAITQAKRQFANPTKSRSLCTLLNDKIKTSPKKK